MTQVVRAHTENQVLRVQIDLGDAPTLTEFKRQLEALEGLAEFCGMWAVGNFSYRPSYVSFPRREGYRPHDILVMRSSLASPWVTILADAAGRSAPIGYGLGAVYCLQRLLKMLMEWQRHRQEIRRLDLSIAREYIDIFDREMSRERELEGLPVVNSDYPSGRENMKNMHRDRVAHHLANLNVVQSAELLDENDGRLRE
jgi:hypothetical protein